MINKKNMWSKKASISYAQILILIISTFALSYLVYDATKLINAEEDPAEICETRPDTEYCRDLANINVQNEYSDIDVGDVINTCKITKDGFYCVESSPAVIKEVCEEGIFPGKKEDYFECELGCCVDPVEGICSDRSPKSQCTLKGGNWVDDETCGLNQCDQACCVLGNNVKFTTEQRCQKLSEEKGIQINFLPEITDELSCLLFIAGDEQGACVLEETNVFGQTTKNCVFTTRGECSTLTRSENNFFKDYLCSNPELETVCEKQNSTSCFEGLFGVYWVDSCGNKENIYSSNKIKSWNGGVVQSTKDACGVSSNDANINNKDCGNCNYILGSLCGLADENNMPEHGEYICKDLSCKDEDGKKYDNGESWCVYEGHVGDGKDVVGSRHMKYSCFDGEITPEPCADYRNEICVQSDTTINSKKYTEASCRVNRWRECARVNIEEDGEDKKAHCEEISECKYETVSVDKDFEFGVCLPEYPAGFGNEGYESAKFTCGQASQKCTAVEVKDIDGWDWVANEDCVEEKFTTEMNNYCYQVGDCGGYVNIAGKYDKGFSVDGDAPNTISNQGELSGYANDNPNQKPAEPGDYGAIDSTLAPEDVEGDISAGSKSGRKIGATMGSLIGGVSANTAFMRGIGQSMINSGAGESVTGFVQGIPGLGSPSVGVPLANGPISLGVGETMTLTAGEISTSTGATLTASADAPVSVFTNAQGTMSATQGGQTISAGTFNSGGSLSGQGVQAAPGSTSAPNSPPAQASFGNIIGAGLGAAAGAYLIMSLVGKGMPQKASLVMSLAGSIGGSIAGAQAAAGMTGMQGFATAFFTAFIWAIIIILIIYAIFKIIGIGETKEYVSEFQCLPWQAPTGDDSDCNLCNTDKEDNGVPCSNYRCESLGQTCELLNEGTGEDFCSRNDPNDVSSPKPNPLDSILSPGYEYVNVGDNGFEILTEDGKCVNEYSKITFGIKTTKPSQCRISEDITEGWEEMSFFGNDNFYRTEHSMSLDTISPEAIRNLYNLTEEEIKALSEKVFYVKCQSVNGVINLAPYVIKTCINPGPDETSPFIEYLNPVNYGFIKFDSLKENITVWINEPADCKYDVKDKSYDLMKNNFTCFNGLQNYGALGKPGWPCQAELDVTNNTDFYIRCLDKPWEEDLDKRNVMTKGQHYFLDKSVSELIISEINPGNGEVIRSGEEIVHVDLRVQTSGGAENGQSECHFKFPENNNKIRFKDTFSNVHEQPSIERIQGDYEVVISCEDAAGNIAENITNFEIYVDSSGPRIIRYYNENGLKITTSEIAECRSSFNRLFKWDNSTIIGSGTTQHNIEWSYNTYYIQCADEYGNKGGITKIKPFYSS